MITVPSAPEPAMCVLATIRKCAKCTNGCLATLPPHCTGTHFFPFFLYLLQGFRRSTGKEFGIKIPHARTRALRIFLFQIAKRSLNGDRLYLTFVSEKRKIIGSIYFTLSSDCLPCRCVAQGPAGGCRPPSLAPTAALLHRYIGAFLSAVVFFGCFPDSFPVPLPLLSVAIQLAQSKPPSVS